MQFVERVNWLPAFDISYHLGVDGISMWLTVLTAFTTLIVTIASWNVITVRVAQYLASFMFLSGLMIGTFASLDGMLFFVFFEATLIPMYLLIGSWGGTGRVLAAVKFFFFSLVGSLMMLMAMLYLYQQSHTFDLAKWQALPLGFTAQVLVERDNRGHTEHYAPVKLGAYATPGEIVSTQIIDADETTLVADILSTGAV